MDSVGMIEIAGRQVALDDPLVLASAAAALALVLLLLAVVRAGRAARAAGDLSRSIETLAHRVQGLGDGQMQLSGGLTRAAEAQAQSQASTLQLMEARLAEVTRQMGDSLTGASTRTARSLGELQQRLETIDKAQANIEKLSGDVLGLQDILSNKQTRGAFGEIQLRDIVGKALPPDSYTWQATLSNGRRADCLVHLPRPPGPIAIDAKFPLEPWEAMRNAKTDAEARTAAQAFRTAVRKHIRDVSERYVLDGETADGALMFLPSEAIYAELHGTHPELVREGFAARVWIVSPTTCMATLTTMRAILKDARMREHAGAIRRALRQLHRDVELVVERAGKLDTHFAQARADLEGIGTAAERAGKRAARLDAFDFEALEAGGDSGGEAGAESVRAAPARALQPGE
jgi:DNA recombination protein RmuC